MSPNTALVLGGGFAGLLMAHVLATHGVQVTILEPHPAGPAPSCRRGTPQDRHPHGLLQRGAAALEQLLPGVGAELERRGARVFDFGADARILFPRGWARPLTTPVRQYGVSRPLLEAVVRDRVLARAGVEVAGGVRAEHLSGDAARVTGVVDTEGGRWRGDVVVDATGRASRLDRELVQLGLTPPVERVPAAMTYATRLFACTPGFRPDWEITAELTYAPCHRRGGVATRIEDDRILLTLTGAGGETAPAGEPRFREYAASLRNRRLLDVITRARPLGPIHRYGPLDNTWRRYHRMRRWPAGLLAAGDAVCTLNPVYGQGMTVAALQALALDRVLDDRRGALRGVEHAFRTAQPAAVRTAWWLAAYSDVGWAPTHPCTVPAVIHGGVRRVVDRIPEDPELYRRFILVQNLLAHPATLVGPLLGRRRRATSEVPGTGGA